MGGFVKMKKKLLILVLISAVIFNVNFSKPFAAEEEIPNPILKPTGLYKHE